MKPEEIVVGGVYRAGGSNLDRRVTHIGTFMVWYTRVAGGELHTKDKAYTDTFASWATERIDQPVSKGEKP